MQVPKIERRSKRPSRNAGGGFDVPKSAGGFVLAHVRQRVPPQWQYGWRWKFIQSAWLVVGLGIVGSLAYTMFFKLDDAEIARRAAQYTYIRNDKGEVVDVAFKPLIDAGLRARKRAARYLEDD